MAQYVFMLGRNLELSFLELIAYLKKERYNIHVESIEKVIAASLPNFDEKKAIAHLGGTLKIGKEVINENEIYTGTKNKITFAVNYYKTDPTQIEKRLANIFSSLEIKAIRKFARSKMILPGKAKMLDLEFIAHRDKLFKVMAGSQPKEYKQRDETRPVFDRLRVISIRLAKILVNLSQAKEEIYDPFCGTGTLLQEALLMGYQVKGSDTHIRDAQENLRWLEKKYPHIKKKWEIMQGDATKISSRIKAVECVVTEPYLGPFFKRPPRYQDAIKIANQLQQLYTKTLRELHDIVKGKIVILFPQILTQEKKRVHLPLNQMIETAGFKQMSPTHLVKLPLLYNERRNNVERLITILEKK